MQELLIVLVALCFVGILLLAVYLVASLMKQHALRQLYADSARDFRFVCELLRLFTKKDGIIKNPCLLRSYGELPPRADLLMVGGGGLLILTVVDAPGQYATPATGNWSVWQEWEMKQIPNAFLPGRQYTNVLSNILMKNGLSCPVTNVVVLTDDYAEVDSLYEENVLTGDKLVPFVREFCRRHALGRRGQKKLIKAIRQHHEICQKQLSSAMAGDVDAVFGNTGEFSRVETESADAERGSRMDTESLLIDEDAVHAVFGEAIDAEEDAADELYAVDEASESSEEVPAECLSAADGTLEESGSAEEGGSDQADGVEDILDALLHSAGQDDT